jgi:hypothetical protein
MVANKRVTVTINLKDMMTRKLVKVQNEIAIFWGRVIGVEFTENQGHTTARLTDRGKKFELLAPCIGRETRVEMLKELMRDHREHFKGSHDVGGD